MLTDTSEGLIDTKEFLKRNIEFYHTIKQSPYDNEVELLPEVLPSAGVEFVLGNDKLAFHAAKDMIPAEIFKNGGWFFQNNLLKGIAGFDDTSLSNSNKVTRDSTIKLLEKLFRLPESAGFVRISYYRSLDPTVTLLELPELNELAEKLFNQLTTFTENIAITAVPGSNITKDEYISIVKSTKKDSSIKLPKQTTKLISNTSSNTKRSTRDSNSVKDDKVVKQDKDKKGKKTNKVIDIIPWTKNNESVGLKVASYFYNLEDLDKLTDYQIVRLPDPNTPVPKNNKRPVKLPRKDLFIGTVTKYAPASGPDENDSLYHVEWEDGDEQDYDYNELQESRARYVNNIAYQWNLVHDHIGKYFAINEINETNEIDNDEQPNKKSKSSNYKIGTVTEYSPANELSTESFKVKFENEEEVIYNLDEIEKGIQIYDNEVSNHVIDEDNES
eukprot:gene20130-26137_t